MVDTKSRSSDRGLTPPRLQTNSISRALQALTTPAELAASLREILADPKLGRADRAKAEEMLARVLAIGGSVEDPQSIG